MKNPSSLSHQWVKLTLKLATPTMAFGTTRGRRRPLRILPLMIICKQYLQKKTGSGHGLATPLLQPLGRCHHLLYLHLHDHMCPWSPLTSIGLNVRVFRARRTPACRVLPLGSSQVSATSSARLYCSLRSHWVHPIIRTVSWTLDGVTAQARSCERLWRAGIQCLEAIQLSWETTIVEGCPPHGFRQSPAHPHNV